MQETPKLPPPWPVSPTQPLRVAFPFIVSGCFVQTDLFALSAVAVAFLST